MFAIRPSLVSDPVVDRIDTFAGKYTPNVVESVMETVPRYAVLKQECLAACSPWSCKQQDEVLAAKPGLSVEKTDDELLRVIDKVHKNLGHPPTQDLVRIFQACQGVRSCNSAGTSASRRLNRMCHCLPRVLDHRCSIKLLALMSRISMDGAPT